MVCITFDEDGTENARDRTLGVLLQRQYEFMIHERMDRQEL